MPDRMSLRQTHGRTRPFYTLGARGCLLPVVCATEGCGMVKKGDKWHKPKTLPPKPHSHSMCPECLWAYREKLKELGGQA